MKKAPVSAAPAAAAPPSTGGPSPKELELPTSRQLLRSSLVAGAVATVILVTAVLPAEYGVDPTGIGRILGLTAMGEIKVSLATEAAAERAAPPRSASATPGSSGPIPPVPCASSAASPPPATSATPPATRRDEVRITLAPNEGKEVKLLMRKGARASYIWSAGGGGVNFDTHGETPDGSPGSYHSYGKGSGKRLDEGEIVAAFDGVHGWFWRNRNHQEVTLTLKTQGEYQEIKESGPIAPTKPLAPKPTDHGHAH